jgi:2-polyprenyl-3-methyl-5-hydroxy-6-metoxy-1,4-benzoquinol methylase
VFVDPVPDEETYHRMYEKSNYHDAYYENADVEAYLVSAGMLREHLSEGARVLDYGCGTGEFLRALREVGLEPFGVEFDHAAAQAASRNTGCVVLTVDQFWASEESGFDAVHLGDVLEHLPEPATLLKDLIARLRPGGLLFGEGPLEINPSPVYWCALIFGWLKRMLRPGFVASHSPTHLFRANARQQLAFFYRVDPRLTLQKWELYETGWPYAQGGAVKRAISGLAIRSASGRAFRGVLGNRFRGLFLLDAHGAASQ